MTPDAVRARVGELLGRPTGDAYGEAVVEVDPPGWHGAVLAVRDDALLGLTMFDLLAGIDDAPQGLGVLLRLWSPTGRHGLQLHAALPTAAPRLATVSDLFAGALWHERSAHEMFGIGFDGHPGLTPLLLAGGPAHPLRKDTVLASRVVKPWPGSVEPGQNAAQADPSRRRLRPVGIPDPGTWP